MRLSSDPETDSLHIRLIEQLSNDSDEVADDVVRDFDEVVCFVGTALMRNLRDI